MPRKITIQGSMTYIPLSGGFWGILAEDGQKFRPVAELPADFKHQGLQVRVSASKQSGFSIFMWGTDIQIHHIEPA